MGGQRIFAGRCAERLVRIAACPSAQTITISGLEAPDRRNLLPLQERGLASLRISSKSYDGYEPEQARQVLAQLLFIMLTAENIPTALATLNIPDVEISVTGIELPQRAIPAPATARTAPASAKPARAPQAPAAPTPVAKAATFPPPVAEKTKTQKVQYKMSGAQKGWLGTMASSFLITAAAASYSIVGVGASSDASTLISGLFGVAFLVSLLGSIVSTSYNRANYQCKGLLYINTDVFSPEQQEEIRNKLAELRLGRLVETYLPFDGGRKVASADVAKVNELERFIIELVTKTALPLGTVSGQIKRGDSDKLQYVVHHWRSGGGWDNQNRWIPGGTTNLLILDSTY